MSQRQYGGLASLLRRGRRGGSHEDQGDGGHYYSAVFPASWADKRAGGRTALGGRLSARFATSICWWKLRMRRRTGEQAKTAIAGRRTAYHFVHHFAACRKHIAGKLPDAAEASARSTLFAIAKTAAAAKSWRGQQPCSFLLSAANWRGAGGRKGALQIFVAAARKYSLHLLRRISIVGSMLCV